MDPLEKRRGYEFSSLHRAEFLEQRYNQRMKNILSIAVVIALVWGVVSFLRGDEYIGFYYPNASDLTSDIQSSVAFDSLEMCRDWVDEQVSIHNPNGSGYDYECGKNCDLSGGKPYICEETLE